VAAGFVALLKERYGDDLDATGRTFLGHIGSAAARMQAMIDDLLTYSRAGKLAARADVVDLAPLVAAAYQGLSATTAEKRVSATLGNLPLVIGDAGMLAQVLHQLVVNAMTFNTSSPREVHICGRQVGASTVITVEDNGIGIDSAHRERAFELFQRLNTREDYAGTGTGLALCRRLLLLQSGDIRLTTAPGGGTTVTITLPRPPDTPSRPHPQSTSLPFDVQGDTS
jgi:light-regulated signal transduction histidine kinase (bacteriophytochrome)